MGKRVLIVEDDELVADHLAMLVRDKLGCVPVVTASSEQAFRLAQSCGCDFGFLDIKLADGTVFPLAERLSRDRIPFVFVSASDPRLVPPGLAHTPFYRKPVPAPELLAVARQHL